MIKKSLYLLILISGSLMAYDQTQYYKFNGQKHTLKEIDDMGYVGTTEDKLQRWEESDLDFVKRLESIVARFQPRGPNRVPRARNNNNNNDNKSNSANNASNSPVLTHNRPTQKITPEFNSKHYNEDSGKINDRSIDPERLLRKSVSRDLIQSELNHSRERIKQLENLQRTTQQIDDIAKQLATENDYARTYQKALDLPDEEDFHTIEVI